MTALQLSYYIINHQKSYSSGGISPLKLQKLLYYVFVWDIVAGENLLDCDFVKWNFGPVNEEVYQHYKIFGKTDIPINISDEVVLPNKSKQFINFIVSNYSKYDAVTLSAMTHKDEPWQVSPKNKSIAKKMIKNYYSKLNFAKNFPISKSKPFYPVETDLHYSYILDMTPMESKNSLHFNSYSEYLIFEKQNQKDFDEQIKNWII